MMIKPNCEIEVAKDELGVFFTVKAHDLDADPLVLPAIYQGVVNTVEFRKRSVTLHPANGESRTITAGEFLEFVQHVEFEDFGDSDE